MSQFVVQGVVNTIFHPFGYAKVLIQLGHEPLEPTFRNTWVFFGRERLYYPSVLKYVGHIRKADGFFGLYRGLLPRIIGGIVGTKVVNFTQDALKSLNEEQEGEEAVEEQEQSEFDETIKWFKQYLLQTSQETLARCAGIIISQPFHVIMVRSMAQFVGRETAYDSLVSSFKEIYNNEGILGFFVGLAPRLIGEVISVYLTNLLAQLMNRYLIPEKEMQQYSGPVLGMLVGTFTYRFQLVSNIMTVNGSGLAVSGLPYMEPYSHWLDCCRTLKEQDQLSRGSSYFRRLYKARGSRLTVGELAMGPSY